MLDLGDRVGVRVQEQATVPRTGEVDELDEPELGLAVAWGHVGEERVLQRHPDDACPVAVADLTERQQLGLAGE